MLTINEPLVTLPRVMLVTASAVACAALSYRSRAVARSLSAKLWWSWRTMPPLAS
ncbi:MAG: hypothetical protein WB611_33330 [Stellaceae bacterium]